MVVRFLYFNTSCSNLVSDTISTLLLLSLCENSKFWMLYCTCTRMFLGSYTSTNHVYFTRYVSKDIICENLQEYFIPQVNYFRARIWVYLLLLVLSYVRIMGMLDHIYFPNILRRTCSDVNWKIRFYGTMIAHDRKEDLWIRSNRVGSRGLLYSLGLL